MITIFLILLCCHFLADYPLQGDFLAKGKNHKNPITGIPWYHCLLAHSAIHGLFVGFVLQSPWFGFFEFVAHAIIDYSKCNGDFGEGNIAYNIDQALHIACKVAWIILFLLTYPVSV